MAKNELKAALAQATRDHRPRVTAAHGRVIDLARATNGRTLTAADCARLTALSAGADAAYSQCLNHVTERSAQTTATIADVHRSTTIRRVVLSIGLLFVFILLPRHAILATILLVILVIARTVAKRMILAKVRQLAEANRVLANETVRQLGAPAHLDGPATGLYAQVDELYLASLDPMARALEVQRRQNDLQAQQMQRMQAEHTAALRSQQDAMEAMIQEQQATNDALYGSPGFIGSALRARDDARRRNR